MGSARCSLVCFKKHKEVPCKVAPITSEKIDSPSTTGVSHASPKKSIHVREENWVLKKKQLQYLVNSRDIHDCLKSEEIRNLIKVIDNSETPEDELEKAMKETIFLGFTEKILSIIAPEE
ncbi:HIT-type Zinc finger family protein isoform X2 [Wolffia australiana]